MKFNLHGFEQHLEGMNTTRIQQVSKETMNQILINFSKIAYTIQVTQTSHYNYHQQLTQTQPAEPLLLVALSKLLNTYTYIFDKPKDLPLHRPMTIKFP